MNGFLCAEDEEWKSLEGIRDEYYNLARRTGLTEGKRIVLDRNDKLFRLIANSVGKLDSIADIVDLESRLLKEELRMVILTDFIRMNDTDCSTLGVVPVWRKLKDAFQGRISLGVLCGSLILLPRNAVEKLVKLVKKNGIADDAVAMDRFGGDDNFVRVVPKEGIRNHIVRLVTEMFNAGDLTVLVGTQALLGEGWEAPSYFGKHEIVSGIERVLIYNPLGIPQTNLDIAKNRGLTRQWWKEALFTGYGSTPPIGLSTGVKADSLTVKSLRYTGYMYYILALLTVAIPILFQPGAVQVVGLSVIAILMGIVGVHYLRTGTVAGVMKQIAIVILETLSGQGLIKTSLKQVGLKVREGKGEFFVSCANLPAEENNLFIQSLQEFLDPVENPRYLLVRHTRFLKIIRQTDYFAIPSVISPNKKGVEIFRMLWKKYIGDCEIVYTRSAEGRKVLLKARKYAFSAIKKKASKRLSKWQ